MNIKLDEEIVEKHFDKIIEDKVIQICKDNFDIVFDYYKFRINKNCSKDTTIGFVYRHLEKMCLRQLNEIFDDHWEGVDASRFCDSNNPFYNSIKDFLIALRYYYDIRGSVHTFISYEWDAKEKELFKKGVIDIEGDYIYNDNL